MGYALKMLQVTNQVLSFLYLTVISGLFDGCLLSSFYVILNLAPERADQTKSVIERQLCCH